MSTSTPRILPSMRHSVDIYCLVDIEQSAESFHAHAIPEGIDIQPGDAVTVHDAPSRVGFGERVTKRCRATVDRAGWFARRWTQIAAFFELSELYEVGFSSRRRP